MNYRLFLTATALIVLTSMTMAQQPPQSHPLSEIYPVDTDLDMEDYNINNLSQLSLNDGSGNTGLLLNDYTISGEGEAQRFVLDYQNDVWSVENSGLDLNGNNISGLGGFDGFFDSACNSGEAVVGIYDNGTVQCESVSGGVEGLSETLSAGNVANQSVDFDGNNISGVGALESFFDSACTGGEAVVGIYDNGTVQCESVSGSTESLSETLSASNSAGDSNINLSGNNLTEVDRLNPDSNELTIGSNVTVGDGETSIAELNRLTDLPLQPTVDDFEDGDLNEYNVQTTSSGEGSVNSVTTSTSESNEGAVSLLLDVEGGADFSNPGSAGAFVESVNLENTPEAGQTFRVYHNIQSTTDGTFMFFGYNGSEGYFIGADGSDIGIGRAEADETSGVSLDSTAVSSAPTNEWLRYEVEWGNSGSILLNVYDSAGTKIGQASISDSEFKSGKVAFHARAATGGSARGYFDGVEIIDSGGIEIDSDVQLEDSRLSDVNSIDGGGDSVLVDGGLDLGSGSVDSVSSINSGGSNLDVGSYLDVNAPSNEGSALDVGGTVSADGGIDSYDNVNIDGDLRVNGGEIDRSVYRTDALVDLGPSRDVLGFSDSFSDGTLDPFQSNTIYTDFTVQNGYANHENLDDGEYAELNLTTSDPIDNYISFRYRTGSGSGSHKYTFNATGEVHELDTTGSSWEWRTFNFEPSTDNDFIWRYEGVGTGADFDDPGFEIDDVRIGEKGLRDSMNVFGSINAREGIDVKGGSVNMNGNNVNMSGGNITSSSQMCMGVYCE